ncbi:hypothetical protein Fleli_0722 [Bernardetia litoralis DSM 6794]|uniref:Tetratricopeptide repeat protein n=1 Tax=Bernardetia litoralis (strain ATCC 23117 / DSM 6794 / NBRC 15988 / NCIMB 1366 / Fx l1 / Sio-4) TaxID=880071 RepID=I4AGU7_BERLS|nr:hypothetical protein [Bernardetia litoralis]AFM03182.1 hypothetical protein Fleli_0722 [Bernardetia litoralis DSM 6794]
MGVDSRIQIGRIGVILSFLITPFFCVESFAKNRIQNDNFVSIEETQHLYDKIFDLEFKAENYENNKIKTPLHLVIEDFKDIIFIILTQDEESYENLKQNEEIRLEQLEKFEDKKSNYYKEYKWAKAEIKLHWAMVKLRADEKWASAWRVRQAYKLLLENEKEFPNFIPQKKSLALLQIALASVPQKYQWALSLVGMEGDLKGGIKKLNETLATNHFFQKETFIWKALLQTYLLEEKSNQIVSNLLKKYPSEKLVLLFSSLILMKNESHQTALFAWQKYVKKYQNNQFVFTKAEHFSLEYLLAELYFYTEKPKKAKFHYVSFLNNVKNKKLNFIKNSYYKLFLMDWFASQNTNFNPKSNRFFSSISSSGISKMTVDRQAKKMVKYVDEFNKLPNKKIYQAKFLTDGGNYQKALEMINQITNSELQNWENANNFETILEYKYRKARILDKLSKLKQTNQAIQFYKEVIEYSTLKKQNEIHYFAANSALHLGYFYQNTNKKTAKMYFEKAISFEGHQYEESITQKAKLALKKL